MSCSLRQFRDRKVKEAMDLIYNEKAHTYRKWKDNSIIITPAPGSKIKTVNNAFRAAESMEKKLEKHLGKKYRFDVFGKWTTIFKSPSDVRIEINIPNNLLKAYQAKQRKAEAKAKAQQQAYNTKTAEIEQQQKGQLSFFDMPVQARPDQQINPSTFIEFRKEQIQRNEQKIKDLRAENRQNYQPARRIKIANLEKLNEQYLEDISEIRSSSNTLYLLSDKIEKDLDLLDTLLTNRTIENINAAEEIISYYLKITDYSKNNENDFLIASEIYNQDQILTIHPIVKDMLDNTRTKINDKYNQLGINKRKYLQELVEKSEQIKMLVADRVKKGKMRQDEAFNIEELLKNIEDIGFMSSNFLTIDKQFKGEDSLLAQLMKIELELNRSEQKSKAAKIIKKMDEALKRAESKIPNMSPKKSWFSGLIKNKDYSMFFQKSALGNKAPVLVNKFTGAWGKAKGRMYFQAQKLRIKGGQDNINKANKMTYDWIDTNANWIDIKRIPRIIRDPQFMKYLPDDVDLDAALEYEQELIDELGETFYNKIIQDQVTMLMDFDMSPALTKGFSNPFMILESRAQGFEGQATYRGKTVQLNPRFNAYYPKKQVEVPTKAGGTKTIESGYYDKNFETIENDPDLLALWESFEEMTQYINDTVTDAETNLVHGSILSMQRSFSEILLDKKGKNKFVEIGAWLADKIKSNFTHTKNKKNASEGTSINKTQFRTNKKEIDNRVKTFTLKLEREFDIKGGEGIDLMGVDQDVLDFIAKELNIPSDPFKLSQMFNTQTITPYGVAKEVITDQVNDNDSANLPVLLRAYTEMTAEYKSQKESQPRIEIFKHFYDNVKKKRVDKSKAGFVSTAMDFLRLNSNVGTERVYAKKRLNYWYNKNVKGSLDSPHPWITLWTTYENHEKELLKEIKEKLKDPELEADEAMRLGLEAEMLGKNITVAAAYNAMINKFGIFQGLAFSVKSAVINRFQGWFQGAVHDGRFWTQGNFEIANDFVMRKVLRYSPTHKGYRNEIDKVKLMVNTLNILQDATNEMDRAAEKTGVRGIKKKLSPFYLTEYVEWHNQTPQILSMLMDHTIKDENGENEVQIFDGKSMQAFEIKDGLLVLKPEYATAENIATWQNFSNKKAGANKLYMSEVIALANGDYSKTGSIKAKSTPLGRTAMLFQTWLPNYIWTRIAGRQANLILGRDAVKGMYSSHRAGTLGLTLGVTGLLAGGPVVAGIAGAMGTALGSYIRHKNDPTGLIREVNMLKETGLILATILAKMGQPVNFITGNRLYKGVDLSSIVRKEEIDGDLQPSEEDMASLNSILTETTVLLSLVLFKVMMKSMLGNDDEEEPKTNADGSVNTYYYTEPPVSETQTQWHNLIENETSRLIGDIVGIQSAGFYKSKYETFRAVRVLEDLGRLNYALYKATQGEDRLLTGVNAGESRLANSTKRLLLPGIFKSPLSLGYEQTMSTEYDKTEYFDTYFYSDYKKDKNKMKIERNKAAEEFTEQLEESMGLDKIEDPIAKKLLTNIADGVVNKVVNTLHPYPNRADYDAEQKKKEKEQTN